MGAEVVKLVGTDIASELRRFARERGVTLLIAGQSRRSRWHRWRYGSVVERLTHNSEGLDVLVVGLPTRAEMGDRGPSGMSA